MPDVLTILDAILLGLVEGITEYLPVSSTGHLVLLASLLGLDQPPQVKEATDDLLIVIQGGAILAVLGLYRRPVARMCLGIAGKDRQGLQLARNIVIAFLPAAILGPLLDETIESHLMAPWPVLGALIAGGILMIAMGSGPKRATQEGPSGIDLTIRAALIIGLLQCLAMWPGTSRSMVTIVGGMWMGLSAARAAEFSFLLGLPTLGGACVYKLMDKHEEISSLGWAPVLLGIAVATVSAAFAVKWLVGYLAKHGLAIFGWYRIALAIVLTALFLGGVVQFGPDAAPADVPDGLEPAPASSTN